MTMNFFCQPGHKWGIQVVSGKVFVFISDVLIGSLLSLGSPCHSSRVINRLDRRWPLLIRTWTTQIIWRHKPDRRRRKKTLEARNANVILRSKQLVNTSIRSEDREAHQIERQPMRCLQQIILLQAVCRFCIIRDCLDPTPLTVKLPCA